MGTRTFALLLLLAGWAAAEKVEIKGTVVDADGNPVAGVEVAPMWDASPKGMVAFRGVATNAKGEFTLPVDFHGRPIVVMAVDEERARGAVTRFSKKSIGKARELTLERLVRVHGRFSCTELGTAPPWTNVYVRYLPGNVRFLQCGSREAAFDFKLPPGDYQLYMYGSDVKSKSHGQWVEGDEGAIDLETIDLEATVVAKHYGKELPKWNVTAARGAEQGVKLSDFRGKWILLEFWGFW